MSNLFGYIGKNNAKDILLSGLAGLKNAGQDMAGVVLKEENFFKTFKIKGSPAELYQKSRQLESESKIGLAQCSREEKIKASSITAPPSSNEAFAAVMDGEIENFNNLKKWSAEPFPILTHEDLLLACLCIMDEKNKISLSEKVYEMLGTQPSFAFISADENAIFAKSGNSKLIIGISSTGSFVSSELSALIPFCEKYIVLESGETAKLLQDRIIFFDSKMRRVKKSFQNIAGANYSVNNYLLSDEIYCCPLAVKEIYSRFVLNQQINFDFLKLGSRYIDKIDKIILIGQDNEKNVALASRGLFETYCGITTLAYDSKSFLLSNTPIDKNTVVIAICDSGESRATLSAVKNAKRYGAKTVAVTENKSSALTRECNHSIITGNENNKSLPVCAFISDYLTLCLFSFYLSSKLGIVSDLYLGVSVKMVEMLSGIVSAVIKNSPKLEAAAAVLEHSNEIYLTSANYDSSVCFEAEKIIRETTKKRIQAVCARELSDYPAELLASGTVFALITDKERFKAEMNDIYRLKNRGANVIIITSESIEEEIEDFESIISFTDSLSVFNIIPCLACVYKIALSANESSSNKEVGQSA